MKTYIFKIPDDYDLKECFKMFDKNKIIFDKTVDHGVFERVTSEITLIEDDPYWGKVHKRIAACTEKLMKYKGLYYVADACGSIQTLEIMTDRIVNGE